MFSCLLPDPNLIVFDGLKWTRTTDNLDYAWHRSHRKAFVLSVNIHPSNSQWLPANTGRFTLGRHPCPVPTPCSAFLLPERVCRRKIFTERIPTVAAPWARRTQRMAEAQQAIGLAAGGSGGTRLCAALAMDGGVDLLLTLIRNPAAGADAPGSGCRRLGAKEGPDIWHNLS